MCDAIVSSVLLLLVVPDLVNLLWEERLMPYHTDQTRLLLKFGMEMLISSGFAED